MTTNKMPQQTIIRLLPVEDLAPEVTEPLGAVGGLDVECYRRTIQCLPPLSICKVFDGYRNLQTSLNSINVVTKKLTEAEVETLLQDKEIPGILRGGVVINAEFPRTYKRQSLGFKLTDSQLQHRFGSIIAAIECSMGRFVVY